MLREVVGRRRAYYATSYDDALGVLWHRAEASRVRASQRSQCSRSKPGRIGLRWQSYRAWIRAAGFVSPRNSTSSSDSGSAAREEEAADDDVSGVFLLGS